MSKQVPLTLVCGYHCVEDELAVPMLPSKSNLVQNFACNGAWNFLTMVEKRRGENGAVKRREE